MRVRQRSSAAERRAVDDAPPRALKQRAERRRVSTVVVQRFCKPKVGGSNPSPGTRYSENTRKRLVPAETKDFLTPEVVQRGGTNGSGNAEAVRSSEDRG